MSTQLSPLIAKNNAKEIFIEPALANRHGLIAGATGTGKTVTLQKMAEVFSLMGVPVFLADIKGDLSGIGTLGVDNVKVKNRISELKIENFSFSKNPIVFWDVYGKSGHPIRATISDIGPLMLAQLLELNETQEGVLQQIFKIADDKNLLILDLKDLQSMLRFVTENAKTFQTQYGNIAAASTGAIQRSLLNLEQQGGADFFGEPMFNILDFLSLDSDGRGNIHLLTASKLVNSPKLYSIFLLWLLSELYENLPESGDLEKPKLVFFFDEAHLLFKDTSKALVDKIEQVVRLIRSKGVGIYFVTQNPMDIPDSILGQLGNRIQHALRAFTPKDQKAVKAAASSLRPNPEFKTEDVITNLGVGEALVSFLDKQGAPHITEKAFVIPPQSKIGPMDPNEQLSLIKSSPYTGKYDEKIDRLSAYEILSQKNVAEKQPEEKPKNTPRSSTRASVGETMIKSAARTMANEVGRQVIRGILGSLFRR
jgi:DNA helicase HerA-like ATPase